MAGPSQEYLDFLQAGMAAGTLTAKQQENYANAVRNNRFEPQGLLAEQAPNVTDIIGGLQALPQSQAYVDQSYGGEDIRGGAQGAYYGQAQDSYNVQDIQAAADAIRASGQPLTQGNKVYDTGNPALNEALYGPDISRNIPGDGTQGFITPRQFDPNYVGEFFAAIPEAVATFYGGQVLGAGLGNLADGLLGGSGVAGATTGNAAQAQAVIDNAISNPIFNAVQEFGGQALDAYDTYGAAAGIGNNVYNDVMDNPAVQGGLNGMIVGTDINGQPIFIQDQELSGGITPQPDEGGGGADSNQNPSETASQPSGATQEGAVVQDSEKPEDPQGFRWVPTGDAENPEWTLIQIDDPAEPEDSGAVFGSDNPLINPMTGEPYFGNAVVPTANAELSQGQVLDGNPTEQVAYDPDAVFGSDDPNIDPSTGEAYVDYTTPDNLGGLSSGGAPTGGSGGGTGGGNGTGDGTGDGEGSGDGNTPDLTMSMFGGMLANGLGEFKPFQAGINYQPQMLAPQQIQIRNYLAELFGNR